MWQVGLKIEKEKKKSFLIAELLRNGNFYGLFVRLLEDSKVSYVFEEKRNERYDWYFE